MARCVILHIALGLVSVAADSHSVCKGDACPKIIDDGSSFVQLKMGVQTGRKLGEGQMNEEMKGKPMQQTKELMPQSQGSNPRARPVPPIPSNPRVGLRPPRLVGDHAISKAIVVDSDWSQFNPERLQTFLSEKERVFGGDSQLAVAAFEKDLKETPLEDFPTYGFEAEINAFYTCKDEKSGMPVHWEKTFGAGQSEVTGLASNKVAGLHENSAASMLEMAIDKFRFNFDKFSGIADFPVEFKDMCMAFADYGQEEPIITFSGEEDPMEIPKQLKKALETYDLGKEKHKKETPFKEVLSPESPSHPYLEKAVVWDSGHQSLRAQEGWDNVLTEGWIPSEAFKRTNWPVTVYAKDLATNQPKVDGKPNNPLIKAIWPGAGKGGPADILEISTKPEHAGVTNNHNTVELQAKEFFSTLLKKWAAHLQTNTANAKQLNKEFTESPPQGKQKLQEWRNHVASMSMPLALQEAGVISNFVQATGFPGKCSDILLGGWEFCVPGQVPGNNMAPQVTFAVGVGNIPSMIESFSRFNKQNYQKVGLGFSEPAMKKASGVLQCLDELMSSISGPTSALHLDMQTLQKDPLAHGQLRGLLSLLIYHITPNYLDDATMLDKNTLGQFRVKTTIPNAYQRLEVSVQTFWAKTEPEVVTDIIGDHLAKIMLAAVKADVFPTRTYPNPFMDHTLEYTDELITKKLKWILKRETVGEISWMDFKLGSVPPGGANPQAAEQLIGFEEKSPPLNNLKVFGQAAIAVENRAPVFLGVNSRFDDGSPGPCFKVMKKKSGGDDAFWNVADGFAGFRGYHFYVYLLNRAEAGLFDLASIC